MQCNLLEGFKNEGLKYVLTFPGFTLMSSNLSRYAYQVTCNYDRMAKYRGVANASS